MDISARIQQIEELVQGAKSMPLSSSVLVNKEEMLELIEAARNELPDEIRQARWVVKDREELLAKARHDGELLVQRARDERGRLVSQEEVIRVAHEEADRLLAEAREQARKIRLEAEDYVDAKLAQFEIALDRIRAEVERPTAQVQGGGEKLGGSAPPAEEELGEELSEQEA